MSSKRGYIDQFKMEKLRRFFHMGPIITICIIKSITLTTLSLNSIWWPPQSSLGAFINQAMFLILSALTFFNFVMASMVGPGHLPKNWKPKNKEAEQFLQYCTFCEGFKAPRSHHCQRCQRCVIKMDHHCVWLNNCAGWANQAYFICFLSFAVIGSAYAAFVIIGTLISLLGDDAVLIYRRLGRPRLGIYGLIFSVFNLGLAIGVMVAVGMLLYLQLKALCRNRTGIEEWIVEKANYRHRNLEEKFVFPYNVGVKENIRQVMTWNCTPKGDGTSWPVAEGCDQYTLTREQMAQKAEKRVRSTVYSIIRSSTGSWTPFWSQGVRVACSTPLTDEPRIKLSPGDLVRVTRWRKHWLFGEKVDPKLEEQKIRVRGWFPRKCAVELKPPDLDSSASSCDEHEGDTYKNSKKLA